MITRIALVASAGLAGCATADIVDMYMTDTGQGVNVRIVTDDRTVETFAGQIIHRVMRASGEGAQLLGSRAFLCIDLHESAPTKPGVFTLTDLYGVPDSAPMARSTAFAIESIFAAVGLRPFEASVSDSMAAAFQLAIWEVASDYDAREGHSSLDLSEGWFRATGPGQTPLDPDVSEQFGIMLEAAGSGERFGGSVLALRAEGVQDQATAVLSDRAVPGPGSPAAFGAGMLLVLGRRRR